MTDREIMINILSEALLNACDIHGDIVPEQVVDYMIKKNTIVLPCNVGETLYFLTDKTFENRPNFELCIYETSDWYFDIDQRGISILPRSTHSYKGKTHYYLDETVFLTREKAEEAKLKELYFSDLDRELDALRESVMKSTETFKKDCIEVMNFYKTVPYAVGVGYSTKEVLDVVEIIENQPAVDVSRENIRKSLEDELYKSIQKER